MKAELMLLQLELQKLWLNRASKVLIFISFVLPFFVLLLASFKIDFFGLFTLELGELGVFNFPIIWHITTFFAAQFKFFFAIVVVSMIGNEYSNRTLKQNLIDGLSKNQFIRSKFYTIVFFSLISTILIFVLSLGIGLYYSSYDELSIIIQGTEFVLAYFIKLVGFFSLCLFFSVLFKRSAFALGFLFVLFIGEWVVYGIMKYNFRNTDSSLPEIIQDMFPLKSMYKLIDQPFQRILISKFPDQTDLAYDYSVHSLEIGTVLIWTCIFLFSSYFLLKKRDL